MTPKIGLIIIGDEVLSGKRQDKHLHQANQLLKPRGLALSWVKIVGDEPGFLTEVLADSFRSGDWVFCFGGIGATPDDRTRQAAAKALGVPIARHPDAVKEIEEQFGEAAYPQRIHMAEYPQGAAIIPNSYNRVPGFSIGNHHFMPGFPMMAKPMMEWVLNHYYAQFNSTPTVEKTIRLINGQESEWVAFMEDFEQKFPQLRLFSLPSIADNGDRTIEMGVEGQPKEAAKGLDALIQEAESRQHLYEIL
ncbi:MAG: competence/damage-inducible protein A [Piscirickettsiaceae bacterium CG_4_9_14_3_um_filter_43_564]|nr:competence/damage-inducible protein A [Thiomicrospira sp.]OIP97011.1 MAG: competence/damage-inducible protein A [Thiomicrospira sp. CG2_30_44_34]PIQ02727.1 MAG: competence/damage-inducible protein A [Piscirickettsiaceae bacterium CG18_big_fil_WC_8_21_14_2_50_44_103]PIU39098.1 MAG: competence/damage-inducible protein A [Piscirickettsiaceae bacterium CG07_land_8_20_14_0_80_44_28]PIW57927.1 MAG: competence/damage-inducible protein A [Piscirickettsiaceae bacterium CG12_big_fil_rev_8_21_14_0_65_4